MSSPKITDGLVVVTQLYNVNLAIASQKESLGISRRAAQERQKNCDGPVVGDMKMEKRLGPILLSRPGTTESAL